MSFFDFLKEISDEISYMKEDFKLNVLEDNRKKVQPKVGSVIYSVMKFPAIFNRKIINKEQRSYPILDNFYPEHSGIYVGDGQVVQLDGSGRIEKVTPEIFINRDPNFLKDNRIYISMKNGEVYGNEEFAKRALSRVGDQIEYKLFSNNCHMFTYGCATGDFLDGPPYLSSLQADLKKIYGIDEWRLWER